MSILTSLKTQMNWLEIPSGTATIGTTLEKIDQVFDIWRDRLMEEDYVFKFRDWLMKEHPQHHVQMDAFAISDILVTNEMYRFFCEATNARLPESLRSDEMPTEDDHPVWGVTFEEAKQYCQWLSGQLGYEVALPTEYQWEYAARGDKDLEYPWGDQLRSDLCNTLESGIGRTTPVRYYEGGRSVYGVYDMCGNVEEWVDTYYRPYPEGDFVTDDLVEALGEKYPVLRGGFFARAGDLARIPRRHGGYPSPTYRYTGFRLVRAPL